MQQQRSWTLSAGGHAHALDRNLNAAPRQWIYTSCKFVPCSCVAAKPGIPDNRSAVERQEFLWRQHFLDPTLWWDCRKDKKSSGPPDSRHKDSKEPLWLNNFYKPDWVVPECQGYGNAKAVIELCDNGQLSRAVDALTVLADTQFCVTTDLLYRVIRRCGAEKNLVLGRRLDDLTVKCGYESNAFLGNHILRMYACQGRLQEAMQVFTRVATPNAFMWFSIISAQTECGKPRQAIQLYHEMRRSGLEPDSHVFVAALKACASAADLESGKQVHSDVLESGTQPNTFVCNCLVDMYAKCGELGDARRVFDSMATRDAVTWNAMINGYAEHGLGPEALTLYARMEQEGLILADNVTLACLLKACAGAGAGALQQGKQLHSQIVERGIIEGDVVMGTSLVNMYVKCGKLDDARTVFDSLATRDAVTWTAMINGYAEHGLGQEAITLYARMEGEGLILADSVTFACLLKACASAGALKQGRQLHSQIVGRGLLQGDIVVCTSLVDMYAKCGKLDDARMVFDSMATRDAVTWNAMINGYAEHELGLEALILYAKMEQEVLILADSVTFACLLKACASAGALQQGRKLHAHIVERRLLEADIVVGNCLVNMYAKCGKLGDARMVFDSMATRDEVTWTAMINGYAEHGLSLDALALYARMEQECLILANSVTFACLLKACASAGALQQGKQLHFQIVERRLLEGDIIVGTSLVDMYAKCGKLDDARMVFDSMATRDVVTWNAMVNGYAEHELGEEALILYERMEEELLILADSATFACLLKACASAGALQHGRQLHSQIVERGLLEGDIVVGNCLVNMYAKCGKLDDAQMVFDSMATRDAVSWNALISGYGTNNEGHKAIACFEEMMLAGVQPDDTTFRCLLVACSHEGLVRKGQQYFDAMVKQHGLNPTVEHYNCMVDLLGRAGHLAEAVKMLLSVECKTNAVGLMSLLNACKSHRDIELGTWCFESFLELDPQNASAYVLMASMYAEVDRWADVDRIERLRKLAGASKKAAVAGIEVNKQVHTFVVGEERADISGKVRSTNVRLKEEGNHVPYTKMVLKPLSEKEKEDELCGHAEKLALAYGLLNTPDGAPLLVTKNLRMCRDCHSSTEIMSRVERRDIVVRDAYRVHRFEAGSCSCKGRH